MLMLIFRACRYPWDENFTIEGFKEHIDAFNLTNAEMLRQVAGEAGESYEGEICS